MTAGINNSGEVPRAMRPDSPALTVADVVQKSVALAKVILFGSRAGGDNRPNSDIDLIAIADASNTVGPEIRLIHQRSGTVPGDVWPGGAKPW